MAMAGKITVAEVEELVEPEALDPNFIHLPGGPFKFNPGMVH